MKKSAMLLKTLTGVGLMFAFALTSSCKKDTKEEDPKEAATDSNDQKFDDNNKKADDSEALVKAADINFLEIETGRLAQTKCMSAHTKEFGKMMVDDHTKALAELNDLAAKKNITLPAALSEDGKDKYNKLNEKSGKDFDKAYADEMVKGHEDAISLFEDTSKNANDADVKTWATGMLPKLQEHLQHAKMLQDENK